MAGFSHWHAYPCLWLQALAAYGYAMARQGKHEERREVKKKLAQLDPEGRLAVARLRPMLRRDTGSCCQGVGPDEWRLPEDIEEPP